MINNESLLDLYVGRRRNGWRNAFSAPRWATVNVSPAQSVVAAFLVAHGPSEPVETITETDLQDPDLFWLDDDECVYCGGHDERMSMVRLTDYDEDDYAHYSCLMAERVA